MSVALAEIRDEPAFVRRMEVGDLTKHGPWLMERLTALAPHLTAQNAAGWIRGFIYSNEHLFLYQDHAVALVQAVPGYGLTSMLVVQERFVWVEDKEDKAQLKAAADFYLHIYDWAKLKGAEQMICMESSDVPQQMIEERVGRLFKFETRYARIK